MEDYSSAKLKAYVEVRGGAVSLDLSGKGLSRIPDAVTELTEVEELSLYNNNITELPTSINKLKNLIRLDLIDNILSELPSEIVDLKELRRLDVRKNQLVSLPASIQKLNQLEELHLYFNKLTELPSEIGDLKELRRLYVSFNQLVSLPTSIQKLNQLEVLHVSGNKLTELPSEIGDLKELRSLNVSYIQLVSLPTSIQKVNQLEELHLEGNKLTELPSEIGDLKELRSLNVSNNQLVSLPTSIQKLNQLKKLHLEGNKLTELPSEIGDLKELRSLNVSYNQLVSLPISIQKLNQLEGLHLEGNKLTELPSGIGDLKELRRLYVSGNPLSMDAIQLLEMKKKGMTHSDITGAAHTSWDPVHGYRPKMVFRSRPYVPQGKRKKPSFEQTAETGMLSKAGKEEEVVETVLPVKAAKKEVVVEPEDETEVEDNTYVGESRIVITRGKVSSEGSHWALNLGALHLIFHPNAVSEPTSIVVYRWKSSVCSPPLQEHEAIVSNVIELYSHDGQRLQFNAMVTLSLSHSAPELRGYEVVIKRQINKETNEWEDVSETKDLRCRQDIEDEHLSQKDIPDPFFPLVQADITECSTYAAVCRLKSSPTYTITPAGGSFSHPHYPEMMITVPENAVAPETAFSLVLKVQEVPNKEFEEEGVFLGPILRIECFEVVQFLRPVTIQLPVSLRDQEDFNPDPTKCHVRVLFLNCEEEKKEWIELTDPVEPTQFDAKLVRIQVQRFSGYSFLFERREENSRPYGQRILSYFTGFTRTQPRAASFVAYFRPDISNILFLICCSAHLKQEVIQDLENRDVTRFADGSSMKCMIPGEDGDKAFVFLAGGIRPYDEEDENNIFLWLLEDDIPFKTELRVCLVEDEELAQVEFRNTLAHTGRKGLLCKFHLTLPSRKMPRAPFQADQDLRELARQPEIKDDSPTPDELESLSDKIGDKWKKLGRRLKFDEAQITEHDKNNDKFSEKAYKLLLAWKERDASAATYSVLHKALSDVERKDLAQKFCCQ